MRTPNFRGTYDKPKTCLGQSKYSLVLFNVVVVVVVVIIVVVVVVCAAVVVVVIVVIMKKVTI